MRPFIRLATAAVPAALLLAMVAATVFDAQLVALIVTGLTIGIWFVWFCGKKPASATVAVVGVVVFSSHLFAVAHAQIGLPAGVVANLIVLKDVSAIVLLTTLLLRALATGGRATPALLLMGVVVYGLIFLVLVDSPAPLMTQLQSFRGAIVCVLALGIGSLLTTEELNRVARGTVTVVSVGAVLALIQLALPATFLSTAIGVGSYWSEVKGAGIFLNAETGLPGNFYTTGGFPRLSGTFGDPLAAGMILGATLLLAIAYRKSIRWSAATITLLSVALMLTFTRNGWILALVGLLLLAIKQLGLARAMVLSALVGVLAVAATTVVEPLQEYVGGIIAGTDASTIAHQAALEVALQHDAAPVGQGWGTGGAAAMATFADAVTSESAYLVILVQLGWLGAIPYLVLILLLLAVCLRGRPNAVIGAGLAVGLAISAAVSENILTFNAGWLPTLAISLVAAAPREDTPRASMRRRPAVYADRGQNELSREIYVAASS